MAAVLRLRRRPLRRRQKRVAALLILVLFVLMAAAGVECFMTTTTETGALPEAYSTRQPPRDLSIGYVAVAALPIARARL